MGNLALCFAKVLHRPDVEPTSHYAKTFYLNKYKFCRLFFAPNDQVVEA